MGRLPFDPLTPTTKPKARRGRKPPATTKPKASRRPPRPTPTKPLPTASPTGRRVVRTTALADPARPVGRRPAADLGGLAPVRLTAYLRPDQYLTLRKAAALRLAKGERCDVSQILRELVDEAFPPKP